MRRMGEEEKPLVCAIMWGAKNRNTQKKFVLQVGHSTIGSSLRDPLFYVVTDVFMLSDLTNSVIRLCIESLCLIFWKQKVKKNSQTFSK
jgi:hypothetical protein